MIYGNANVDLSPIVEEDDVESSNDGFESGSDEEIITSNQPIEQRKIIKNPYQWNVIENRDEEINESSKLKWNMDYEQTESICIIGPTKSGKTTLATDITYNLNTKKFQNHKLGKLI